jgi:hypothetical protein
MERTYAWIYGQATAGRRRAAGAAA